MKHKLLWAALFVCSSLYGHRYSNLFKKETTPLAGEKIVTDTHELARVAQEGADFLSKLHKSKYVTADVGVFKDHGLTLDQVQETLSFIADTAKKRPRLLSSPWFYNTHFDFYRWYGDETKQNEVIPRGWKKAPEHIRTTKYRITEISGTKNKTKKYFYPLYETPQDERMYSVKEREKIKDKLIRFRYSRSEILNGALDNNPQTKPLAWVTEKGRKEFVLQGSALVKFRDGSKKLLRVGGENEREKAESYWYATEVAKRPKNTAFPVKVKPRAGVTYAADVDLLGFGKIIALVGLNPVNKQIETRLGVLVDTGKRFQDNLSKLDIFTGYFKDDASFKAHAKTYPHTARAYVLIKKKEKHV